jgi:hypothetical protein
MFAPRDCWRLVTVGYPRVSRMSLPTLRRPQSTDLRSLCAPARLAKLLRDIGAFSRRGRPSNRISLGRALKPIRHRARGLLLAEELLGVGPWIEASYAGHLA